MQLHWNSKKVVFHTWVRLIFSCFIPTNPKNIYFLTVGRRQQKQIQPSSSFISLDARKTPSSEVMEFHGEIFDEMFDLKPIFPEIYTDRSIKPQISVSDNGGRTSPPEFKNNNPPVSWNSSSASTATAAPKLISFDNTNSSDLDHISNLETINFSSSSSNDEYLPHSSKGTNHNRIPAASRTPLQAQDHVVAERKRRENLTQLFISLSKVVPGLKKLDKASLLEDGINYVKALQERVQVLEEEEERRSSMDAAAAAREDSSSYNSATASDGPEIQARISEKHVLIKIFCRNQKGLMSRIPCKIMEMNLNVLDMRIMPFGGTALDITILAQMQREFKSTVKDIVDHLHTLFMD